MGDYPDPSGSEEHPIPPEQWAACEQRDSVLVDPVCLAFDTERRTSIAAAGRNADGYWHVEVLEKLPGTHWVAGKLADLEARHSPLRIVCDGAGPAASIVPAIEEAGITVATIDAANHAAACGRLVDVVSGGQLRHRGSLDLWNAIRERRPGRSATAGHGAASHRTWTSRRSFAATLALAAAMGAVRAYGRHRDLLRPEVLMAERKYKTSPEAGACECDAGRRSSSDCEARRR